VLAKPIEVPAIAEGSTSSKAKSKKDKKKAKKAAEQQRAAALAAAEAKKKNQKGKADVVGAEMSKQSATKLDEFYSFDEEFSDSEQRDKQTKEQNINKVRYLFVYARFGIFIKFFIFSQSSVTPLLKKH